MMRRLVLMGVALIGWTIQAQQKTDDLYLLDQTIKENAANHLAFLQELSRTTEDGEAAVQALVAKRMKQLGCEVEEMSYRPSDLKLKNEFIGSGILPSETRISVVGTFKGRRKGPSLLMFAHPDNPVMVNLDKWSHDPFGGEIDDGKVYGWGVADDLGGVAIMIEALAAVQKAGLKPAGDLVLCSTPAKRGAHGVIALLSQGYTADRALYLHPAESGQGMKEIKAFASGLLRFKIELTGWAPENMESAQTAYVHKAINPVNKSILLIQALNELNQVRGERVYHPLLDQVIGRSTNIMVSNLEAGEDASMIRIPKKCIIGGSVTFPPQEKLEDVKNEITECINSAAAKDPWLRDNPPNIIFTGGSQGVETRADHPLYHVVSQSIMAVTGEQPYVNALHTAGDIRNPILYSGIPTVGIGPLAGRGSGLMVDKDSKVNFDTWVDADDYIRAVQVTARIILNSL